MAGIQAGSSSCLGEHVLAYAANRADPVSGKILECSSRGDSVVGIPDCRIIFVSACIANILIHGVSSSDFLLPQSVEIAVLVDSHRLVTGCQKEFSHRLLAGLEILLLISVLRLEDDELDEMVVQHGM